MRKAKSQSTIPKEATAANGNGEEVSSMEHNHIREISFSMQKFESMDFELNCGTEAEPNHG